MTVRYEVVSYRFTWLADPDQPAAVAAGGARAVRRDGRACIERALYDAPVSEPHIRKVRPSDLDEVWRVPVASSNDLSLFRS